MTEVGLPVVRGDAEHEALVAALAAFLAGHRSMSPWGSWSCSCGWRHPTVSHAEHVAAVMAVQRPWAGGDHR